MRYALACLVLAACGGGGDSSSDANNNVDDDAAVDAAPTETMVVVSMMATRTLDTAYYGVNLDSTFHVEIYKGAAAGCPNMDSPTPEYTLLLGSLDAAQSTAGATFLDYTGDMLPDGTVYETATAFAVTGLTKQDGAWAGFTVDGTFPSGTGTGHVYATHCTSLDE